jgi:hypothetical protein
MTMPAATSSAPGSCPQRGDGVVVVTVRQTIACGVGDGVAHIDHPTGGGGRSCGEPEGRLRRWRLTPETKARDRSSGRAVRSSKCTVSRRHDAGTRAQRQREREAGCYRAQQRWQPVPAGQACPPWLPPGRRPSDACGARDASGAIAMNMPPSRAYPGIVTAPVGAPSSLYQLPARYERQQVEYSIHHLKHYY